MFSKGYNRVIQSQSLSGAQLPVNFQQLELIEARPALVRVASLISLTAGVFKITSCCFPDLGIRKAAQRLA